MSAANFRQQQLIQRSVFISCIVPVHNEELGIATFIEALYDSVKLLTERFEIIVIDDGSQDRTLEVLDNLAEKYSVKTISFSRNFGKEIAITAGLDFAQGDVGVIIDADFQHPLNVLPLFLDEWAKGYDMVYGLRQNRDNESAIKRFFANKFYQLMKRITKTNIPANAGDFRLLDRAVITALNHCEERHRFMKGLYGWVGYRSIGVPYKTQDRATGKSSFHFTKLAELAITGITSFSSIPLRVWSLIGFFISMLSLSYAICIVFSTLLYGSDVPGYATIVVATMFLGGIQLLSIGILGEYIGRIFDEVKKRPKYIIAKKLGFDNDTAKL